MSIMSNEELDEQIELYQQFEEENKDDSKLFSDDLVSTLETKEKDITTGELLKRLFNGEPKNINPLTEIPQSQMRLYGFSGFLKSAFFDTEEELIEWIKNNNTSIGEVCIIDYLGNVAGRDDVIRLTYKNGKSDLCVACDEDGYGIYNNDRSIYKGVFVWEYNHGSISEMYSAFRDRGITFENDIYGKVEERNKKIFEMINNNEKGPVLTKKKVDKDKK